MIEPGELHTTKVDPRQVETPRTLTERQSQVYAEIVKVHDVTGEGASVRYLARRLSLHHSTIQEHLAALRRKRWLRSSGSPAVPRDS